jgi:poly(3-hydroxybutyrate) depolymerase
MKLICLLLSQLWLPLCAIGAAPADPGAGQPVEQYGTAVARSYLFEAANNQRMPYEIFVPTSYGQGQKPAPLIVLLHGLLSNPWQVIHYMGIAQEAEKRGYIVVAPAGYNDCGWYGSRGPGKDFDIRIGQGPDTPDNLGALSEQDVLNVLALVKKQYSIDPKRIYLMGHSMGGGGTFYLGMKYKEQWAALAAMSPAVYGSPDALESIRKMPVMVVQGDHDILVHVGVTRRWVAKMQELKMDIRYLEIKGGDHLISICMNPKMISQVFDFFDQHTK